MNLKEQHAAHLERQARFAARAVVQREERALQTPPTEVGITFLPAPKPPFRRELSELSDTALSERIAKRQAAGFVLPDCQKPPPTALLIHVVARHCGVEVADIKSKRRTGPIVRARQICFWMMRQTTRRITHDGKDFPISYPEIARRMGGWNHTSVLHGCTKLTGLYANSTGTKRDLDEVLEKIRHAQYEAIKPRLSAPVVADMAGKLQEAA